MKRRATVLLWIPPIVLLCIAAYLHHVQSRIYVVEREVSTPSKLAKLAEGVESGHIILSKVEVVTLIKDEQRLEEDRARFDEANEGAARSLAELLAALAVVQMMGIGFYLREEKRTNEAESNET